MTKSGLSVLTETEVFPDTTNAIDDKVGEQVRHQTVPFLLVRPTILALLDMGRLSRRHEKLTADGGRALPVFSVPRCCLLRLAEPQTVLAAQHRIVTL